MTIGIAIPTFSGHLYHLNDLLSEISKSTVLPKQVSVSISSFDGNINFGNFPFELIVTKTKEERNTAQNCNTAASKLDTDIISIFGGDDLPHRKRNEYIIKSFESGCNSVVHNYIHSNKDKKEFIDNIGDIELFVDYIDTYVSDYDYPISSVGGVVCYANGPISISQEIFKKFKFGEGPDYIRREDSMYNSNLVKNGYKISYIKNNLMLYIH